VTYAKSFRWGGGQYSRFFGNFDDFPISAPFDRENGKPNQAFAGKFPLPP
jgi:hypothetical protein